MDKFTMAMLMGMSTRCIENAIREQNIQPVEPQPVRRLTRAEKQAERERLQKELEEAESKEFKKLMFLALAPIVIGILHGILG